MVQITKCFIHVLLTHFYLKEKMDDSLGETLIKASSWKLTDITKKK